MNESAPLPGLLSGQYTVRASQALAAARNEAGQLGHPCISTEHLLLGVLHIDSCPAARLLRSAGLSLERGRQLVAPLIARSSVPSELLLTPRARYACELAQDKSEQLKQGRVDTLHLLAGLLQEARLAARRGSGVVDLLRRSGLDLEAVDQALDQWLRGSEPVVEAVLAVPPLAIEPQPTCPSEWVAAEVRARLAAALLAWVETHRPGLVAVAAPLCLAGDQLIADLIYSGRERLYAGRERLPELAVLVVDSADAGRRRVLIAKLRLLLELGVGQGLLADPFAGTVQRWQPDGTSFTFNSAQRLELPTLLPGWSTPVSGLWPPAG